MMPISSIPTDSRLCTIQHYNDGIAQCSSIVYVAAFLRSDVQSQMKPKKKYNDLLSVANKGKASDQKRKKIK